MATIKQKIWTYDEYLKLNDEKRYEIIEGELIEMPSPYNNLNLLFKKTIRF